MGFVKKMFTNDLGRHKATPVVQVKATFARLRAV